MRPISLEEGLDTAKKLGMTLYRHELGRGSETNVHLVYPRIVTVARLAIRLCKYDGTVINGGGTRTLEQAKENVKNGTGILNSRHIIQEDGHGHAIDLIPYIGKPTWELEPCKSMAHAVKVASAILFVPIRQGCDWNMNGTFGQTGEYDWCHFENPIDGYMHAANAEMLRTRRILGLDELPTTPASSCRCPVCNSSLVISTS